MQTICRERQIEIIQFLKNKYGDIYEKFEKLYGKWLENNPLNVSLLEKRYYEDNDMILFYHSDNFMSNFSEHSISINYLWPNDNKEAMCSEMLFQCMKFFKENHYYALKIAKAKTPKESAILGRDRSIEGFDPNWSQYNFLWMIHVLLLKIKSHPELKSKLLITQDKYLIENSARGSHIDNIWGAGKEGNGKNILGICWMCVRSMII